MVRAEDYNFVYGKGNRNHQFVTRISIQHRILSAFKRVEFVRDRISNTRCPRRNVPNFGRVFLMLNYTDIT
jgi:hypothetical protein